MTLAQAAEHRPDPDTAAGRAVALLPAAPPRSAKSWHSYTNAELPTLTWSPFPRVAPPLRYDIIPFYRVAPPLRYDIIPFYRGFLMMERRPVIALLAWTLGE